MVVILMSKDNKFPIKYAVLELKQQGGYSNNYEDIIRGYIVSKCWLVESSIKYFSSGESEISHKVIFPYSSLDDFKASLHNNRKYIGKRIIPSYDACDEPYPVDIVTDLFDTYEEAKAKAKEKNDALRRELILTVPYRTYYQQFKPTFEYVEKNFKNELAICQLFEDEVEENTKDMIITPNIEDKKGIQLLKKL